jgi:hypothetical protein
MATEHLTQLKLILKALHIWGFIEVKWPGAITTTMAIWMFSLPDPMAAADNCVFIETMEMQP